MLSRPLSKTALQQGAQCPRMLWIKYNEPFTADLRGADEADQEQFRIGNIVGDAARHYFAKEGKTVLIDTDRGFSPDNYSLYADETAEAMADPEVVCIAEATFYTGDIVVFIDLLHRREDGDWDIYEVKASRYVNQVHVRDASWQTYVARELCGAPIVDTYLMHPSNGTTVIVNEEYDDLTDVFEVVDNYTAFIGNYSSGAPSPEQGWMNGLTIEQSIDYLVDVVESETPPLCEDPIFPNRPARSGSCSCCTAPYKCNFMSRCRELQDNHQ